MSLLLVGAVLSLCLLPSLLFLGFWKGLCRMQRGSLIARTKSRSGHTDPAVTWSDVIDAYSDPQKSLFAPPSESRAPSTRDDESRTPPTRDIQCSVCAAENAPFASFCRNCSRKLE